MKAHVYSGAQDHGDKRWDAPSALWVTEEDVLNGAARMPCPDCGGTGHFPVPDPDNMEDFCVMCKGTGLILVSV